MKAKQLLLVILPVLLLMVTVASPVIASTNTYQAIITHTAIGSGAVGYSEPHPSGFPYDQNIYFEPARGGFIFGARCSVMEIGDGNYEIIPGTVKANGFIWTSWTHENTHYSISAWIYAADLTQGVVTSVPGNYYVLGTMPDETSLAYKGFLREGGSTRPIEGYAAVMVSDSIPGTAPIKMSALGLYVDAASWLIMFGLVEEPTELMGIDAPAALIFNHHVELLENGDNN
jgi:hypothetical protein